MAVEEFLKQCQESGDAAYAALRTVLERLEDPKSRVEARVFLSDLYSRVGSSDDCFNKYHFMIQDITLDQYEVRRKWKNTNEENSLLRYSGISVDMQDPIHSALCLSWGISPNSL